MAAAWTYIRVAPRPPVRLIFLHRLAMMDHQSIVFNDVFWNTYLFIGSMFGEIDGTDANMQR
jgi:hypothetical protein